jgi:hypothetical protein
VVAVLRSSNSSRRKSPPKISAKAVIRSTSAVSRAHSVVVSSYGDCATTSAETICSFGPAAGSGAAVLAGSVAELLRALLPERGAGREQRRQVDLHLGPYHPRRDGVHLDLARLCTSRGRRCSSRPLSRPPLWRTGFGAENGTRVRGPAARRARLRLRPL